MSDQAKIKVHLHGSLKELHDGPVELSGATVAEVINGLKRTLPGFANTAHSKRFVKVVGYEEEQELFLPLPANVNELHIVPAVMGGGGGGGFLKVVLGVVLVAVAFAMPVLAPGLASFSFAGGATIASMTLSLGVSLILGGVISLLSPAPDLGGGGNGEENNSKYLGAQQNTTQIGTRIPLPYGYNRIPGHFLSINVDAVDVAS